jgi:hypothetical protein
MKTRKKSRGIVEGDKVIITSVMDQMIDPVGIIYLPKRGWGGKVRNYYKSVWTTSSTWILLDNWFSGRYKMMIVRGKEIPATGINHCKLISKKDE